MLKAGGGSGAYICKRDDGTGGCAVEVASGGGGATFPLSTYAQTFTSAVLDNGDIQQGSTWNRACIDNDVANTGTCAEDRDLACTTDAGGDGGRTGLATGNCWIDSTDYGPCEGLVDALRTDMIAQESINTSRPTMWLDVATRSPEHRGLGSEIQSSPESHALAQVGNFSNETTVWESTVTDCNGGGGTDSGWVYFSEPAHPTQYMHPSYLPIWDVSSQPTTILVIDWAKFNNQGGGFSHINIMPAHWLGRDSANNAADCNAFEDGGTQDDGVANSACDSVGLIHLGAGFRGHFRYISTWYGGGEGFALSLVDGTSAGFGTELGWSQLNDGEGLATDASGWWFHDKEWRRWNTTAGPIWYFGFATGMRVERDKFINNDGPFGIVVHGASGTVIRDIEMVSNNFVTGMFRLLNGRQSLISGVTGYGNRGIVWNISPEPNNDIWDMTVEHVNLAAQDMIEGGTKPQGLIVRYDQDGNAFYKGGNIDNLVFRDHHYTVSGTTNVCMIFLEGGDGSEDTVYLGTGDAAAHGAGRTVDDDRHQLSFDHISIERVALDDTQLTGDVEFFCLGNGTTLEQDPSEAMTLVPGGIFDAKGGMPRWTGLSVDGMFYPNNPYRSVAVRDGSISGVGHIDNTTDINTGTDVVTLDYHGFRDRDEVTVALVSGSFPGGGLAAGDYFVEHLTWDTFKLYTNRDIATGGVDFTTTPAGTWSVQTGYEPDCDGLPQGTVVRSHSATAEGNCDDADSDGLLDGGGDYNALCVCGA
jgi:hypothetical protein